MHSKLLITLLTGTVLLLGCQPPKPSPPAPKTGALLKPDSLSNRLAHTISLPGGRGTGEQTAATLGYSFFFRS
jgi:hypothetical protein